MPSLPQLLISRQEDGTVASHKPNPVVAFIIGLSIVTLASILNAAGLNLTKLDHVRLVPLDLDTLFTKHLRFELALYPSRPGEGTGCDRCGC